MSEDEAELGAARTGAWSAPRTASPSPASSWNGVDGDGAGSAGSGRAPATAGPEAPTAPGRRMTTVVFFDVAGTLIRVRDGVGAQYARVAARFGVVADPKALEREFPRAFRAAPRMAFPGAPADGRARARARGLAGHRARRLRRRRRPRGASRPGAFDAYFDAVYRHFEDAATWDVFPDVVPALVRAPSHRLRRLASSATSTAASCGSSTGSTSPGGSRR